MAKKTKRKKVSKTVRAQIYNKFNGHCAYCGRKLKKEEMTVDHIKPLNAGGTYELTNLNPACRCCNNYKSSMSLKKFRKYITKINETMARDSNVYAMALSYGMIVPQEKKVIKFYYETHKANKVVGITEPSAN